MESGTSEHSTRDTTTGRPIAIEEAGVGAFGASTRVAALALGAFAVIASVVRLLFRVTEGVGVVLLLIGVGVVVVELKVFRVGPMGLVVFAIVVASGMSFDGFTINGRTMA